MSDLPEMTRRHIEALDCSHREAAANDVTSIRALRLFEILSVIEALASGQSVVIKSEEIRKVQRASGYLSGNVDDGYDGAASSEASYINNIVSRWLSTPDLPTPPTEES